MNANLRFFALALLLILPVSSGQAAEYTGTPITLELKDAPLGDVFHLFQELSGQVVEIEDDDIQKRILTIDVRNVPWDKVLDQIIEVHGLTMTRQGDVIYISETGAGAEEPLRPGQVVLETRLYRGAREGNGGSDILPVGGPMLLVDSVWVKDWLQQERMIQETFGLKSVNLLSAPKIIVLPGEPGTITVGSEDGPRYELTLTAWPGESNGDKVRVRSEFIYNGTPFSETEVIATAGRPYLMGGREDGTGDYLFLSVLPRVDGHRTVSLSGKAARVGEEGVEAPVRTQYVAPAYPREMLKQGVQGLVVLDTYVNLSGEVTEMIVLSADHDGLVDAAKRAVAQWKYEPARKEGKVVPAWMVVKVQFRLE